MLDQPRRHSSSLRPCRCLMTAPRHHTWARYAARFVGYFGTIVVARTARVLAREDGMELFGFRHRWLRDLSDGWQMVETPGPSDPPRLADGAAAVARSTGAPVLGQYVSGGDCTHVQTALPGIAGAGGAPAGCHRDMRRLPAQSHSGRA
jgi:hypothetical protein